MARSLLIPYAYCSEHKTYHRPDWAFEDCPTTSGTERVRLRTSTLGTLHYFRPGGGGGGGPETAAHIFGKLFIKESLRLYAVVDGEVTLVRFSRCDVEQRIDLRTPDVTGVIEHMWPPRFPAGTTFLVEIHATNQASRDPARIPALRSIGMPCVEITLPRRAVEYDFGKGETDVVEDRFERYMREVMRKPFKAHWLVPESVAPWMQTTEQITFLDRSR